MKAQSEQRISLRCIDAKDTSNPLSGKILNLIIWKYSENGGNFLASNYTESVIYFAYKNGSAFNGWYSFSDDATLFAGTNIQSGDDLNDYKTPGIYNSPQGGITQTLLNMPEIFNSAFTMLIFNPGGMPIQVIIRGGTTDVIYIRIYVEGWRPWYKFTGTQISS